MRTEERRSRLGVQWTMTPPVKKYVPPDWEEFPLPRIPCSNTEILEKSAADSSIQQVMMLIRK
jgi:hypothetical protein